MAPLILEGDLLAALVDGLLSLEMCRNRLEGAARVDGGTGGDTAKYATRSVSDRVRSFRLLTPRVSGNRSRQPETNVLPSFLAEVAKCCT